MISFVNFKAADGTPIYLQILNFIKRGAAAGIITDGDELPSRRYLSALLGINPNTVQKAFSILEEEGLIESRSGAKSVMTLDEGKTAELKRQLLEEDIRSAINALKQTGITKEEAIRLLSENWEGSADQGRPDMKDPNSGEEKEAEK